MADSTPDPLALCLDGYEVLIPSEVLAELREMAVYDDDHGRAAAVVLDRTAELTVQSVGLAADFPLMTVRTLL